MGFPKHLNDWCAMDLSPVLCFGWETFFCSRKHIILEPQGCLEMSKPCSGKRADTHTTMWGTVWLKKAQMKKGWEEMKEIKQWASLSQSTYNFLTCTLPQWPCLVISQHWLLHFGVTAIGFPHLYLSLSHSCCPQSCADCLTPTLHSSVLTSHTLSFPSGFVFRLPHTPPPLMYCLSNIRSHRRLISPFLGLFSLYVSASLCRTYKCEIVHEPALVSFSSFTSYDALGLFPVSGFSHHSHCSRLWHISKQRRNYCSCVVFSLWPYSQGQS